MKLSIIIICLLIVPSASALASLLKRIMQGNLSTVSHKDAKANTPASYQNMMSWFAGGNGGFDGEYDDDNLMWIFNSLYPQNRKSGSKKGSKRRNYGSSEESSEDSSEESGEDWIDIGGGKDVTPPTLITTPKPNIDNYSTTEATKVTTTETSTGDGKITTPSDDKNDDKDEDTTISTSTSPVITTESSDNKDDVTDDTTDVIDDKTTIEGGVAVTTTTDGSVTSGPSTESTNEEDNEDGKTTTVISSTDGRVTFGPSTESTNEEDTNDISTTTVSLRSSTSAASTTTSVYNTSPGVTLYTTSGTNENIKSTNQPTGVTSTTGPSAATTSSPVITTTIRGDTIFSSLSNINRIQGAEETDTTEGTFGSFRGQENGFVADSLSNLKVNDISHSQLGQILTNQNAANDLNTISTNQIPKPKTQVFFKVPSELPGASAVEIAIATAHMKEGDGWVIVPPSPNEIIMDPVQLGNAESNTNSISIPKPVVDSHTFSTQTI